MADVSDVTNHGFVLMGDIDNVGNHTQLFVDDDNMKIDAFVHNGLGLYTGGGYFARLKSDYINDGDCEIQMPRRSNATLVASVNGVDANATGNVNLGSTAVATINSNAADSSGNFDPTNVFAFIQRRYDLTAQTAAATVFTHTVPAGTFSNYRLGGYITVTASTASTITLQLTYTDETNTSRTQQFVAMGAASANITAIGSYVFPDIQFRAKAGTSIVLSTTATGTSRTYNLGATFERLR